MLLESVIPTIFDPMRAWVGTKMKCRYHTLGPTRDLLGPEKC